jgi:hypothetical protein
MRNDIRIVSPMLELENGKMKLSGVRSVQHVSQDCGEDIERCLLNM